jgi:hypothetical protein
MDSVHTSIRTSGRGSPTDGDESVCEILHTRRWKVVRVGDDGVCMRGHSTVLLPSNSGSTTKQEGDRATTRRMEYAKDCRSTNVRKVSDADNDPDMFIASRSLQSGRGAFMSGMLSLSSNRIVSFDNCVVAHTPINSSPNTHREACKGSWKKQASDRRRIKQTLTLGGTFTDDYRDKVKRRLFM